VSTRKRPRPAGLPPTRAVIVHVERRRPVAGATGERDAATRLTEAVGLARAIDLDIVAAVVARLGEARPATLLGTGKVAELGHLVAETEAQLVVVNGALTPIQQRNLEKAWNAKVLDRTGLILEIFGRRASTREGRLQVELAHLSYQKSRLVRTWTHLERQRGGFGFMGGPGERQLEADRRLIEGRIGRIETQLAAVIKTRALHRKGRARVPYPVAALVGYTNAGKSTLFNRLSGAAVPARDLLFATLDPTMRVIALPHGRRIVVSDTVGFISELPTTLIAAFRATLEEVIEADLILHVRDVAHAETEAQAADVTRVLDEIGIDEIARGRIVEVWNKADLLDAEARRLHRAQVRRRPGAVLVSAATGEGLDDLLQLIEDRLGSEALTYEVFLDPADGQGQAWLHARGEVLDRLAFQDGRIRLSVKMTDDRAGQARARFGRMFRIAAPQRAAAE
jgi:GTP-binding protein HflX